MPGPHILCRRSRRSRSQGLDVDRPVRHGLGAVAHHHRAVVVRPARDAGDVVHGAERVGHVRGRDELDVPHAGERLERLIVEFAPVGQAHVVQLGPGAAGELCQGTRLEWCSIWSR